MDSVLNTFGNCTKFAVDKSTVSVFNKENKFKPCSTEQLLNMFNPLLLLNMFNPLA